MPTCKPSRVKGPMWVRTSFKTENSYKFTPSTLRVLLDDAGFKIEQMWQDPRERYALTLAGPQ